MKLSSPRDAKLEKTNTKVLRAKVDEPLSKSGYYGLLFLLADMLDGIANNESWYCIVGATKDKSAFSLTVVGDAGRDSVYAVSLQELASKAETFS